MLGNNRKVIILGAGGLGREACWVFAEANGASGSWDVMGFIDENPATWGRDLCGLPVLGDFGWVQSFARKSELSAVCAVGSPIAKRSLVQKAERAGLSFCSVVHPGVRSSKYIEIGLGTVITAGCILTTQIKIGNHVYLNLDTTVGHDVAIHDFANIAPGCHISGNVTIKEGADVGTGAVVLQGVTIGKWATIGAAAVVLDDVPDNAVVVGVPGEVIKYNKPLG